MAAPMLTAVLAANAIFLTVLACRLIRVLGKIRKNRRIAAPTCVKRKNVNTMIILGSGDLLIYKQYACQNNQNISLTKASNLKKNL